MRMARFTILLSALASGAWIAAASSAGADDDDPMAPNLSPWRVVLEKQLKQEQGCDLNEILAFQEVPIGDDVGVDGHISCFDGRQFDFTRKAKLDKFTIKLCAPAVC